MHIIYVDFDEMLAPDLVLLAATDTKETLNGEVVSLNDGMEVTVCMNDTDENGRPDALVATGVVEANKTTGWGGHVKWCCRIDANGIRHKSER